MENDELLVSELIWIYKWGYDESEGRYFEICSHQYDTKDIIYCVKKSLRRLGLYKKQKPEYWESIINKFVKEE